MLYTITKSVAEIQDKLDDSATSNWYSTDHKVLNKVKACGKWALAGLADVPTYLGLVITTAIVVATVEQKFGKN